MQVLNMCYLLIQSCKFMEMGSEEAKRVYLRSNMPVSCMSTGCRTDLGHLLTPRLPMPDRNHRMSMSLRDFHQKKVW